MSEDSSSEEWIECETKEEALKEFYDAVFTFANIILKLCLEEERKNPKRYEDKKPPSDRIKMVKGLLELMPSDILCIHYVNYVLTWREKIEEHNDVFFLENDHIYPGAPKDFVEFFRDLWRPDSVFHLTEMEKDSVYEYFEAMINFCDQWKKMAGYTAAWELANIVREKGEDKAYKYIMSTYNVDEFEDFGFSEWDEFMAKWCSD